MSEEFERVQRFNALVRCMIEAGRTHEEIIIALSKENECLYGRLTKALAYIPAKVVLPDGRVAIWRCPDAMVPEIGSI